MILNTDNERDTGGHANKDNEAGTNPERNSENPELDGTDKKDEYNYDKKPDNHPSTDERLINPDRGE